MKLISMCLSPLLITVIVEELDSRIIDSHPMIPAPADVNFDSRTASV